MCQWKKAEKECLKFKCPHKKGRRVCGGAMCAFSPGTPTYDMYCSKCGEKYQVKSKKVNIRSFVQHKVKFPAGTRSYTAPAIRAGKFNLLLYEKGYRMFRISYISGEDMKKWASVSRRGMSPGCMVTIPGNAPIFQEVHLSS